MRHLYALLLLALSFSAYAQKESIQEDQIDCVLNKRPYACHKLCLQTKDKLACSIARDPANAAEIENKGVVAPESLPSKLPENSRPISVAPAATAEPETKYTWIVIALILGGVVVFVWNLPGNERRGALASTTVPQASIKTSAHATSTNEENESSLTHSKNTIHALSIVTNRAIPNGEAEAWVKQVVKMTCKYGVYEDLMEKTTKIGFAVAGNIDFRSPMAVFPVLLFSEQIVRGEDIDNLTFGDFSDSSSGIQGCVVAHFRRPLHTKTEREVRSVPSTIKRLSCSKCGASIHPDTAKRTGGLCVPCKGSY